MGWDVNMPGKTYVSEKPVMIAFARMLLTSARPISCSAMRLAGQLEPLLRRGLTQGNIAQGAGFRHRRNAGPVLSGP